MANLDQKIKVELYNISISLDEIIKAKAKENMSKLELAGMATFLHNFYNGIENILKQILLEKNIRIEKSDTWHKKLLAVAVEQEIITIELRKMLSDYLAFRHFFVHGYGFMLEEEKLMALSSNISEIFTIFQQNINKT